MHYKFSKEKKTASVVPGDAVGHAACSANTVKSSLREKTRFCATNPLL